MEKDRSFPSALNDYDVATVSDFAAVYAMKYNVVSLLFIKLRNTY